MTRTLPRGTSTRSTARALGAILGWLSIVVLSLAPAHAGEIVQYFPAAPPGVTPPPPETGWRIRYEILQPLTHGYGGAAVWEIQSVEFMRGYTPAGEPDWIKILSNLALAEMYVPYYDGFEIWDIAGFSGIAQASADYVPGAGVISGSVQPDGAVIAEVADDHVRWMSVTERVRRGQVLDLWAVLSAVNYRYIIRYSFHDDGTIKARVGGTAQNLRSAPVGDAVGIHVHMGAWRMEFDLGAPAANEVHVVERIADPESARARLDHRSFNNGTEGGEVWNPERFTTLMVMSTLVDNRHTPPHKIGYKLIPVRAGSTRTFRRYTHFDFWATLLTGKTGSRDRLRFIDVPAYAQDARPLAGQPVAIWTTAAIQHVPRTEDFGPVGYYPSQGLAITMWAGFDLMPHNLWDRTPLLPPDFGSAPGPPPVPDPPFRPRR